jgi:glyoxylase-like metal-dependent hydrolase (beta-lactamase superfamily II)
MLHVGDAKGIHRIEDAHTNWYLVESDGLLTIVDTGVPASWGSLHDALGELGRNPDDLAAIVLTHAHFDRVGFAERARTEYDLPVWVDERDVPPTCGRSSTGRSTSRARRTWSRRRATRTGTSRCTSPTGTPSSPATPS